MLAVKMVFVIYLTHMKLNIGEQAPGFNALDQDGGTHSLSEYNGKWVLLYFYPKDETPGCITEACKFRDAYAILNEKMVILGVSQDGVDSHKHFAQTYHLPFPLLADPDKTIIHAYGANGVIFAKRTSFLIDPAGIIRKIYPTVNPEIHTDEVLRDIQTLTGQ